MNCNFLFSEMQFDQYFLQHHTIFASIYFIAVIKQFLFHCKIILMALFSNSELGVCTYRCCIAECCYFNVFLDLFYLVIMFSNQQTKIWINMNTYLLPTYLTCQCFNYQSFHSFLTKTIYMFSRILCNYESKIFFFCYYEHSFPWKKFIDAYLHTYLVTEFVKLSDEPINTFVGTFFQILVKQSRTYLHM